MSSKAPFETQHHIVPIRTYFMTLLALLVLMIATVLVAVYVQFPSTPPIFGFSISGTVLNQGFAMLIAIAKASLVVLIFMGVKWNTQLTKLWAVFGFVGLFLFTQLAGDYGFRQYEQEPGWEGNGGSALPREINDLKLEQQKKPTEIDLNVRPRQ